MKRWPSRRLIGEAQLLTGALVKPGLADEALVQPRLMGRVSAKHVSMFLQGLKQMKDASGYV